MDFAKQLGRSTLAIAVLSLSGCQLLQFGLAEATASSVMRNDHAQSVMVINHQMDQYLSEDGRESFLNQMLVALESDNRDKFKGKDPDTYTWWKIRVQPNQWKEAEVSRPVVEGVDTSKTLEFMDVSYRSKTTLNLRSNPSLDGEKLGELTKGEVFNAIAKVEGEPWLLVEQKGLIRGYVHKDYARSNVVNRDILSIKPNPLLSDETSSVDKPKDNELFGSYTCRDLSYELTKNGNITTGSLRACRKQRKIWYIDAPAESSDRS
ncbi:MULTISPECIES: SH3 domain-containing protein [Vibrio]|uniref:SH3 domain-containing protein n=1 Tax=Vibrio TaxID=662 RepID=UPI00076AB6E6|nr:MULTISPECIES: SH3 domain-containing protein [Vibrio]